MIPILYRADGSCVGPLADCTRCYTTQERNGLYEAEIDYPMSSPLFSEISDGCYCIFICCILFRTVVLRYIANCGMMIP